MAAAAVAVHSLCQQGETLTSLQGTDGRQTGWDNDLFQLHDVTRLETVTIKACLSWRLRLPQPSRSRLRVEAAHGQIIYLQPRPQKNGAGLSHTWNSDAVPGPRWPGSEGRGLESGPFGRATHLPEIISQGRLVSHFTESDVPSRNMEIKKRRRKHQRVSADAAPKTDRRLYFRTREKRKEGHQRAPGV